MRGRVSARHAFTKYKKKTTQIKREREHNRRWERDSDSGRSSGRAGATLRRCLGSCTCMLLQVVVHSFLLLLLRLWGQRSVDDDANAAAAAAAAATATQCRGEREEKHAVSEWVGSLCMPLCVCMREWERVWVRVCWCEAAQRSCWAGNSNNNNNNWQRCAANEKPKQNSQMQA